MVEDQNTTAPAEETTGTGEERTHVTETDAESASSEEGVKEPGEESSEEGDESTGEAGEEAADEEAGDIE